MNQERKAEIQALVESACADIDYERAQMAIALTELLGEVEEQSARVSEAVAALNSAEDERAAAITRAEAAEAKLAKAKDGLTALALVGSHAAQAYLTQIEES